MNKKHDCELGYKELLEYIVVFVILVTLNKIVLTAYRYYDMGVVLLHKLYIYSAFGLLMVLLLSFTIIGVGKTILIILTAIFIIFAILVM